MELVHTAEGLLVFRSPEEAKILSTLIPSFINGEHVDVLVEARQLEDGSPSNEVRVTIRNADGVELGSQHTQVQLLGNADEIRRALLAEIDVFWQPPLSFSTARPRSVTCSALSHEESVL